MLGDWDLVVIDEAGQQTKREALFCLLNAESASRERRRPHVFMCGDPAQLQPFTPDMVRLCGVVRL